MQISLVNTLIAFAGGLLSFLSPCVLPLVPGYISLMSGVSIDHLTSEGSSVARRAVILNSLAFNAGLSVIFLALGGTAGVVGSAIISNPWVRIVGGLVILVFYSKFRRHLHKVEVVSGVILILIGGLVMTNRVTLLASSRLAGWLPNLESRLKLGEPSTPAAVRTNGQSFPSAPDVGFTRLDGGTLRLTELRGRVVVLNFWATWCIPCRSEIPSLSAMQKDFESRGLSVIGVSYDDTADLVQRFQKEIPQNYQIVLGGREVGAQLPASPLPTTYIIDREGRIRNKMIGERTRAAFESAIKPLLDEAPATAQKND